MVKFASEELILNFILNHIQNGVVDQVGIDRLTSASSMLWSRYFRNNFKKRIISFLSDDSLYRIAEAILPLHRGIPLREDEQLFGDLYQELIIRHQFDPRQSEKIPPDINSLNWHLLRIFKCELHQLSVEAQEQAFANVVLMKVNGAYLLSCDPKAYRVEWLNNFANLEVKNRIVNSALRADEPPHDELLDEVKIEQEFNESRLSLSARQRLFCCLRKEVPTANEKLDRINIDCKP